MREQSACPGDRWLDYITVVCSRHCCKHFIYFFTLLVRRSLYTWQVRTLDTIGGTRSCRNWQVVFSAGPKREYQSCHSLTSHLQNGSFASTFAQPAVFHQASNAHRTALGSSQIPGSTHSVSRNIFPTSFCHESWRRYNPFATQLGLTGFPWRGFDHFCSYLNHYKCLHLLVSSWTCMTNWETNTSLAS